jgi:hypothetical protein
MAKASVVVVSMSVAGDAMTQGYTSPNITNATSPAEHQQLALTAGNNAIALPTGTTLGVIIVPPSGSVVAKLLKSVNGDAGIPIAPATPMFLSFVAGTASFVLNAASGETVDLYWS